MKLNRPLKVKKADLFILVAMLFLFSLIMHNMVSDYLKNSDNSITGLSFGISDPMSYSLSSTQLDDSVITLINSQLNAIGTDKLIQDYLNNYETLQLIGKESETLGLPDKTVYQALFYHESYYFRDSPIRCEGHYESKWKSLCSKYNNADCSNLVYCKPSGSHGTSCSLTKTADATKPFHRVSCSYGIGQIMFTTALDQGFSGTANELVTAPVSLKYSLSYLKTLSGYSYVSNVIDLLISYNSGPGNLRSAKNNNGDNFINYVKDLPYPKHSTEYVGKILAYSLIFKDIEAEIQKQLDSGKELKDIKINKISVSDTRTYVSKISGEYEFTAPATSDMDSTISKFNPSFSINFPYNFEIYDYLKQISLQLMNEFSDLSLLDLKLRNKLNELNSMDHNKPYNLTFKLGSECGSSDSNEENFHSFTQDIYSCSRALNYPCGCEFSQAYPDNYLLENYSNYLRVASNNYPLLEIIQNLSIENKFLTMRDVKLTGFGLVAQNTLGLVSTNTPCDLPPKSIYRFCVQTDQYLPIYDSEVDLYSIRPVTYKFALDFASKSRTHSSFGTILEHDNQNQIHVTSNLNHKGPRTTELITAIGGTLI